MEKGLAYFWLITLFFIGLCIGSFLNVVIYRLPWVVYCAGPVTLPCLWGDPGLV